MPPPTNVAKIAKVASYCKCHNIEHQCKMKYNKKKYYLPCARGFWGLIEWNPSSRPTVIQRLWCYGLNRSSVLADKRFQLTIKSAHMIDSVGKEFLTHLCVSQLMNTHAVLSSEVKSPRKYFFHFVFVIVINQSYPSD